MNKKNIIISLILIIFSILAFSQTYGFRAPTSKIFPRAVLITLFFLAIYFIIVAIKDYRKNKGKMLVKNKDKNRDSNIRKSELLLFIFLGIFLYIFAINYLGFYLSTYIFMTIVMYFLGIRNIFKLLVISISSLLIIYAIFSIIINVPTPEGIFI